MTTRKIAGQMIEFDAEGFMIDPAVWNKEIATALAEEMGLGPLVNEHWTVVHFCRSEFDAHGEPPTLRRITKGGGVPTKMIYKLFPKGPAKKIARMAGLGKPTGCI